MAVVMVSASTGVMNSLMRKLTTLMGEEYRRLKNVHKEVASLRDELSSMNAFLERLADTDELDVQTKEWRNHVREMTYDIEDCTDDFVHRLYIDGADDKDGFVHEITRRLKDLRARHKIAKQIRDLKARVQQVSERRTSAYPEDDYIHRDDLVRQWVAEGFVSAIHQRDVEEVAGSYFNELINRSMIQPLYTDNNGDVLECRVHDMILDLIVLKSAEENFFTVVAGDDDLRSAVSGARHEVRRLCHRPTAGAAIATAATTASAAHIRSFVFSGQCSLMVPLNRFKFLRVLNLHVVQSSGAGGGDVDLTSICRLFHLRYLKVTTSENARAQLPEQIRGLQHLETLEVHGDLAGGAIPSDVVHLPRLSHLIVPGSTRLPEGIGSMRSLRTLEVLRVDLTSMDGLKSLGELASLRSLGVWCFGEDRAQQPELWDTFWSSIASLASHGLRGLTLFGPLLPPAAMDMAGRPLLPVAEYRLQTLDAQLWLFHGVPQWIGQLRRLHRLDLTVNSLRKDGVDALAALPALLYLCLRAVCPPRRWLVVGAGGFPALVDFFFTCSAPRLAFKEGAMPKVKCIHLTFHAHGAELFGPVLEHLAGLRELPSLELLSATIGTGEADIEETMAAEGALWRAFMNHPRNARVHTQRADGLTSDFFDVADGDDHDGSGVDLELM
ncbi:hypothetical protein E2562_009932 [Oryza meyeriana var. granulata]|uniref:Uncharacterized protein n=1 Tax=Oryza meyeriana var. granulata TaxID=110450 RepID=A0A6G1BUX0_9ORYZ|nr:hypothetical protein E2562_009932 [Oryza meyeriana var. granulata]